ncbi:MAG: type 2 lanthipeptide synthetase LanM [Caulobacterales bacterium]
MPLAEAPRRRVRAAIAAAKVAPAPGEQRDSLIGSLEGGLFARLFEAASRTLVLQLGVAGEHGLLTGESPEDRFAFFCECLRDRTFAASLMAQTPALARRLTRMARFWEAATIETISRLERDFDALTHGPFGLTDAGAWTHAQSLGDPHHRGRTVQRITFASGANVIYKPRPVAMERGFLELVEWLNSQGLDPDLAAAPAIARGDYGWTGWIEASPCADAGGVGAYFRRQGGNLALAYLLGAVDLHYENVIAAGDYPIIVDLETLFHETRGPTNPGVAGRAAARLVNDSVIRTLLLPVAVEGDADDDGATVAGDPSALGYVADAEAAYLAEGWEASGTDGMRLAKIRAILPAATCLPEFEGRRMPAAPHVEKIVGGFSAVYDFLAAHREQLSRAEGPLDSFLGGRARRVLRPTVAYVRLLDRSWHPRFAEDAPTLETDLDTRLKASGDAPPLTAGTRQLETRDLINGDVPYFAVRVGPRTGWNACRRRLAALSDDDKARQLWITRMSLETFEVPLVARPAHPPGDTGPAAIESAARRIGERLEELAIRRPGRASWMFPALQSGVRLSPAPVGLDLYDGLSGIGLFLGGLALRTGEARYGRLCNAAMAEALGAWRARDQAGGAIGAFDGAAGLAWTLAVLGKLLRRSDWTAHAGAIVKAHASAAASEPAVDLISGRAGFLAAGASVAKMSGDQAVLATLEPCAKSLLNLATGDQPTDGDAGLAHGRAGIGLAMARLAEQRADDRAFKRALTLIAADVKLAERARRAEIPALDADDGRTMIAWCRGGLGATLAMMRLGAAARPQARRIVDTVAAGLSAGTLSAALCPCHGALGMLEFLESARAEGVSGAGDAYEKLLAVTLGRILEGELCADHFHAVEAPGLMKGLAGTGWSLLRMLAPATFPSVLTLEAAAP